ncbi:MAG: S1 family peptidase [Moorea sp. SIO3F7]|nr:S1 family peptidase [Moorena sp. SIO3F7]
MPSHATKVASMLAACLTAIALTPQAQAVAMRHDTPEARYLELGARFSAVGFLRGAGGSAVLVAPNKVLTAAHVVDSDGDGKIDSGVIGSTVAFGANLREKAEAEASIKSITVLQQYYGPLKNANDVAVITLNSPISNIEPAKIVLSDLVGRVVTTVGYGIPGVGTDFDESQLDQDFRRRAAQNIVDAIVPADFEEVSDRGAIVTDFDSPDGDNNSLNDYAEAPISDPLPLALEGMGTPGDSGGGIFADFGQGFRLVGIASASTHLDDDEDSDRTLTGRYGTIGFESPLARPDTIGFLAENGVPLRGRQVAVPEPMSAALFGLGLLTFSGLSRLGRRRSRR